MQQLVMSTQTNSKVNPEIIVVDDHASVLDSTINAIKQQYAEAKISTAHTAESALALAADHQPDLMIVDLCIPQKAGETAKTEAGIQLLRDLMQRYSTLNLVVQSAHTPSLVRLKPTINAHEGGFTIAAKSLALQEMLTRVDWALQGLVFTPKEMRTGLEMKSEWLKMLNLAFEEGLQDKAIAERMNISERTVRHYWTKIQDGLGVYPDDGLNIRIQTGIRARQEGLID